MLLGRTPSCCTAVKRKLRVPSEEIWITDTTLAWAFQRLCLLSRPSRRHGTSVPGPMECRRRLGKRRMAHFSEAVRPPIHDFTTLWGLRGTKENNNWQWEAPCQRPERDATDQLPSWLTGLDQSMANSPKHEHLGSNGVLAPGLQSNTANDLEWFRGRIHDKMTSTDFSDTCRTFYQTFKQSLSLGQVSASDLAESMREVPRLIQRNAISKDIEHALCFSFFQTTWEGIMACKVLGPAEIETDVLRMLLTRLPRLPVHMSSALIADILRSITDEQKHKLEGTIYSIAEYLFLYDTSAPRHEETSQFTKVTNPTSSPPKVFLGIDGIKDIIGALMETFQLYKPGVRAKTVICQLVRLSTAYANRVVFSGTNKSVRTSVREGEDLRKAWLKLIARAPAASEDLLVEACEIMRAEYHRNKTTITLPRLRQHILCDTLFEYWASRMPNTSMTKASMIKAHAAFRASFLHPHRPHKSIVFLCLAFKQHSIPWHEGLSCFLRTLRRIRGDSHSVYYCLKRLENAEIYLEAPTLSDEMKALSKINLHRATKLHRLYSRDRPKDLAIPLERFPFLAIAMIRDRSCNPREIFHLFGGFRIWKEPRTTIAKIKLVEMMALEFSQTNVISSRAALRNIAWCIRYLNQYKVPISKDIVRALTNLGIEGNIIERGSISSGRLHWALRIVALAEGPVVAERMRAVLVTALCRENERKAREYGRNY